MAQMHVLVQVQVQFLLLLQPQALPEHLMHIEAEILS
jgi:hypothetical protein